MNDSQDRLVATVRLAALGAVRALGHRRAAGRGADARPRSRRALDAAYAKYKDLKEGANADYIPALAKVDSNIYGIALVTADGKVYTAGDVKSEVSIQSISKVFTMAQVIEEQGADAIVNTHRRRRHRHALQLDRRRSSARRRARRAGDEPAGQPGRDHRHQHGQGREPRRDLEEASSASTRDFAGRPLTVNQEVFKSEAATNQRNQAIGAADVRLRASSRASPTAGDRHLHRAVLDQRQRARTSRRWRRRSPTAARTR